MNGLPLLLVDDNEDDVFFTKKAIKEAKIINGVQTAVDGQEAIEYLSGVGKFRDRAAFPVPALMLLDLKMPRKSGFEVLEWTRQQPLLRTLVVVVLSTSCERSDIEKAYQLGANSFLQKPSSTEVLAEMMSALKQYWLTHNQFFTL
ncbi:MAG: two-component system response regulator [Pedosphaera sp.]|nr:two-component system response regulator [Pedosphaera sp.]